MYVSSVFLYFKRQKRGLECYTKIVNSGPAVLEKMAFTDDCKRTTNDKDERQPRAIDQKLKKRFIKTPCKTSPSFH